MSQFVTSHAIRSIFSHAMSKMYRTEVPLYGDLVNLVEEVNQNILKTDSASLFLSGETDSLERITQERHGAIRLGSASELSTMRRLFAIMGMHPVSYYDLSVAGIPVHSTAFRPIEPEALEENPFRIFTSLLRLDLIKDNELRFKAKKLVEARQIFTDQCLDMIVTHQSNGGFTKPQAKLFVTQALETFRWHKHATVDSNTYQDFSNTHKLAADVLCFRGPHINHLTPRTLDIDAAQALMIKNGIDAKDIVEGPPARKIPILLRQTSFKALSESVQFKGDQTSSTHTARFGEIEQRGIALTAKGRALYDTLLDEVRQGDPKRPYQQRLEESFQRFPDDLSILRQENLAFVQYRLNKELAQLYQLERNTADMTFETLLQQGVIVFDPIIYEDFLPVSAAGIFQSNLNNETHQVFSENPNKHAFERALGCPVYDEFELYKKRQDNSLITCLTALGHDPTLIEMALNKINDNNDPM